MRYTLSSARELSTHGNYKDAITHYLIVLSQINVEDRMRYEHEFKLCITRFVGSSPDSATTNTLRNLVSPVTALFPRNLDIYRVLVFLLNRQGLKIEAWRLIQSWFRNCHEAPKMNNSSPDFRVLMSNLSTSVFDSWHMIMLNNKMRNSIYAEAINRQKNDTGNKLVLEIGSGTGLLSVLANRNNFDVIAVEENEELVKITRHAFEQNDVKNGKLQEVVHCNSAEFDIQAYKGTKADILISEIFDCCAFGENIIKTYLDAHQNLLKPEAAFIPSAFTVFATLIQSEKLYSIHAFSDWRTEYVNTDGHFGLEPYWCDNLKNFPDHVVLSEPFPIIEVDLINRAQLEQLIQQYVVIHGLQVTKSGTVHSIIVHWHAKMGEDLILDSAMEGSCWDYGIFPVRTPLPVKMNQLVPITVCLSDEGKRLDIAISKEICSEASHGPIRIVKDLYLNLFHEKGFMEEVENDLQSTDHKIYAATPFNWEDMSIFDNFIKIQHEPNREISLHYEPTILVKKGTPAAKLSQHCYMDFCDFPCDRLVFWPFSPDGGLHQETLQFYIPALMREWMAISDNSNKQYTPPRVTPSQLTCHGYLVFSDTLAERCRLQPDAHLGINLRSPAHPMDLFECRDIYLNNFEHKSMSNVFQSFHLDLQAMVNAVTKDKNDEGPTYSYDMEINGTSVERVVCTEDGEIDGILYWWKAKIFNSCNLPCASFVFPERIPVTKGQVVEIRCDMYQGHILMSIESH